MRCRLWRRRCRCLPASLTPSRRRRRSVQCSRLLSAWRLSIPRWYATPLVMRWRLWRRRRRRSPASSMPSRRRQRSARCSTPSRAPPYARLALAQAVQALPIQLSAEQAQVALGPNNPNELRALAQAMQALAAKLNAEQAAAALGPLLEAMKYEQMDLARAVQALAPKLSAK